MSRARLRALRLVGFKSFAERTVVEFGPGISAVIGPNGSGKSNLADALRWSLGEQGRTLRTRRAEDLIFAGSSTRRAQGMADVTLVIDNEDRLLPVDYGEVELGRRLFRSGENEYLLNRQRVRLRDLVDLLDEANLADNAFLFIGQGMVDQALALRPEERRPLFEEAAGTRKHERRRRAAEAELAEAEANLERVRDLLAELRPQARRLAAQADQQAQRRSAGADLAAGLVAVARERLRGVERESALQRSALEAAHREADEALLALRGAEETASDLARGLAERAAVERAARESLEAARGRVVEVRLGASRLASDLEAMGRDRVRLVAEQEAVRGHLEAASRELALPAVEVDDAAEDGLRDAERRLADAARTLAELREAGRGDEQRLRGLRHEREVRLAELGRAGARAAEANRRLREQEDAANDAAERATGGEARRAEAAEAAARAAQEERAAEEAAEAARAAVAAGEARAQEAAAHAAAARGDLVATEARAAALDQLLAVGQGDDVVRRLRAAGGRPVTAGLEVEPALRRAVEAALGDIIAGMVVRPGAVADLADTGGSLVLEGTPPARGGRDREAQLAEQRAARILERAAAAGGGPLDAALRRDPGGLVGRLLARCAWVPALPDALDLGTCGILGAGWRVVTAEGEVVTDEGVVRLSSRASLLERRAERQELDGRLAELREAAALAEREVAEARSKWATLRGAAETGRGRLEAARRARRVADEVERGAVRTAEAAAREAAWAGAQLERLRHVAEAAGAEREALEAEAKAHQRDAAVAEPDRSSSARREIAALEDRVVALTRDHDRWVASVRAARERVETDRERRRRAELRGAMESARGEDLDRDLTRLAGVEADLAARRDRLSEALAAATADESRAAAALRELEEAGRDEQGRLIEAERSAREARERLRGAEARARTAEVRAMEVRVQLDAAREGLLVELAGIGSEGLTALVAAVPGGTAPAEGAADDGDQLTVALESALDLALEAWRAETELPGPLADGSGIAPAVPTPGRLATLRRRYHELGAGNPFAADELAEVGARVETLEAQRADLETAIRTTRELISRLDTLIVEQFRTTFAALEDAFARRFRQLFDGGEAQLSLTQPEDLGSTGVEITARPPGKKRQPLAMLSGGERSLTAVALLLAMLEVRPVPFCVLDEVDAALDEANVGRFSTALRGLAESIQFIVITHNRGTIEAADALYGVTVGDDAVSRVVSLRLDGDAAEGRPARLGGAERPTVAIPVEDVAADRRPTA